MSRSRAVGLLGGFVADRIWGDPRRGHPVALFGVLAERLEQRIYRDARVPGVMHAGTLVGACTVLGWGVERLTRNHPGWHAGATALATWTVLGGRSLEREALTVHGFLAADDLPGARHRLTYLVGRDPSDLTAEDVSRAVVESVAENTSDAVTTPLVWGAIGGVPGLLAHRAANTLDAMVGHRNDRYEHFGWASARLDDLLGLPGSRYGALAVMVAAPRQARQVWRVWRRDAAGHPSPNAGVVESAFAGALDLTLGGVNRYGDRVEHRPTMGDGAAVTADDVVRTTSLAHRVGWIAAAGVVAVTALRAAAAGPPLRRPGARQRQRFASTQSRA